jgi:hypothetical protein
MEQAKEIISRIAGKKIEAIELIREARDAGRQALAFNSRPFVLCGLPLRRPPKDVRVHERRNGNFILRVTADVAGPGLPFGIDRLIPIWLSTLAIQNQSPEIHFRSAAEMLRGLGLRVDGRSYRRIAEGFQRIFFSNIYWGTLGQGH